MQRERYESHWMRILESISVDPDTGLPLWMQLAQQITWLIASHQIRQGEMLPPIRALAKHLGVNMNTVRAAYQQLEAHNLVAARQGVGTVVLPFDAHRVAREAPRLRTFTVGVLIPGLNPFYVPFLQGIEETAQRDPSLLFICYTHDDALMAKKYMDQLIAKRVDGLIVTSCGLYIEGEGESSASARSDALPPIVYVDQPDLTGHLVLLDSEGAGYLATSHLLEHGHDRVGLITCPLEWPNVRECYLGYRRALSTAGKESDPTLIATAPAFTLTEGYEAAQQLLDMPDPPTAIFGAGDLLAIGAMEAMKARGLRIPDDVAVAGYNDIDLAALVEPPLTTVAAPSRKMGVIAMAMLQRLIAGESVEDRVITLDTKLIIRRSCGCNVSDGHK